MKSSSGKHLLPSILISPIMHLRVKKYSNFNYYFVFSRSANKTVGLQASKNLNGPGNNNTQIALSNPLPKVELKIVNYF